jgi:hypothetical protein
VDIAVLVVQSSDWLHIKQKDPATMTDPPAGSATGFHILARRHESILRRIELLVVLVLRQSGSPAVVEFCFLVRGLRLSFIHIGFQVEWKWWEGKGKAMIAVIAMIVIVVRMEAVAPEIVPVMAMPAPIEKRHGNVLLWLG